MIPSGFLWGALYFAFGERTVAAIPAAYSVLTLLNLAALFRWRRHEVFRVTEHLMALVLPVLLQIALGGYVASGGVIFWSFLAALLSLLYGGEREALGWFAAWIVAVVGTALLQPSLSFDNALPRLARPRLLGPQRRRRLVDRVLRALVFRDGPAEARGRSRSPT